MLTQEFPEAKRGRVRRVTAGSILICTAAVIGLITMRHDFWWWDEPGPLLLGFIPVGLWWQGLVSICASLTMWLLVTLAWPAHLEEEAIEAEKRRLAAQGADGGGK